VVAALWVRTAEGTWERTATLAYAERGLAPTRTEVAPAERAAQLEQFAARAIVQNAENSSPVIAARFEATPRRLIRLRAVRTRCRYRAKKMHG
jgi:hypothetical protein